MLLENLVKVDKNIALIVPVEAIVYLDQLYRFSVQLVLIAHQDQINV